MQYYFLLSLLYTLPSSQWLHIFVIFFKCISLCYRFTRWSHCLHVHNETLQTPLVCISTGHLFAPKYIKKTRMVTYYCNFNIGFYQLFSALTRTFLIRPSLIGDANPIDHLRPIWWRSLSWTTPVKLEKSTVCHS